MIAPFLSYLKSPLNIQFVIVLLALSVERIGFSRVGFEEIESCSVEACKLHIYKPKISSLNNLINFESVNYY